MLVRLLLACAILLATTPAAAAPKPLAVIPLEPFGDTHMATRVSANGKAGLFLVDTAGGVTSVSPRFAAAIGCKPWGQITGFRMRGDRLDLQRCDDAHLQVGARAYVIPIAGVFDFSRLTPPDAPKLDGLLALDAFAGQAVTLDLAHRRLIVESPRSLKARTKTAAEVPVRYARDAAGLSRTAFAAATGPNGQFWMELDSGSDGAFVVGKHVAADMDLDPASAKGQPLTLQMAGGPKVEGKAIVAPTLIYDGNIGIPILKGWIVTFDLARERLWIAPAR